MTRFSLTVAVSMILGWLFLTIWRSVRRWRSTENLMRSVVYAGFWSNDGVCHYSCPTSLRR